MRSPRRDAAGARRRAAGGRRGDARAARRRALELAGGRVRASLHRLDRTGRLARDHSLRRRHVESLLSSLHEYGHALYERQIDPALERTNLGHGTSMSSTSPRASCGRTTWRAAPRSRRCSRRSSAAGGFEVAPAELHAALVGVEASPVRVSADPLTYPLHIVVRFELELALVEGDLAVVDLPDAWREGMRRLLGSGGPLRRARLPAGRALGGGQLRLLPQLRARLPDRGAAVGDPGDGAGVARGGAATGTGGGDPALARRARAPARPAARHDPRWSSRRPAGASRSRRSCATWRRSPGADDADTRRLRATRSNLCSPPPRGPAHRGGVCTPPLGRGADGAQRGRRAGRLLRAGGSAGCWRWSQAR